MDAAQVVYVNSNPYNKVDIENWNPKIPFISWNNPVYNIQTNLSLASGGSQKAGILINTSNFLYNVKFDLQQFNIKILYPYLKDYLKVKSLEGMISSTMSLSGNMHKPEDIAASGLLGAEKFSIIDNTGDKLVSLESLKLSLDSINTKSNFYNLKSVEINRPFFKFAMYDDGYNFQRIMTSPPASSTDTAATAYANLFIMMADYVESIMKNYVASNYSAGQLKVNGGHLIFTDYTHGDKFQYDLDSIYMLSDRVSSKEKLITVAINTYSTKVEG